MSLAETLKILETGSAHYGDAAGYFARGNGTRLGSWVEFRSGAELAYRFADRSRLGIAVHHISNAGLTKQNPGEQSVVLMYSVPLR